MIIVLTVVLLCSVVIVRFIQYVSVHMFDRHRGKVLSPGQKGKEKERDTPLIVALQKCKCCQRLALLSLEAGDEPDAGSILCCDRVNAGGTWQIGHSARRSP